MKNILFRLTPQTFHPPSVKLTHCMMFNKTYFMVRVQYDHLHVHIQELLGLLYQTESLAHTSHISSWNMPEKSLFDFPLKQQEGREEKVWFRKNWGECSVHF